MTSRVSSKRLDVGYKRPPVEHQFKPGQKPPPRKKRPSKPASNAERLAMILREEQRIEIGGKARWCTKAELVVLIAFNLADRGNASVLRALVDYLITHELPVELSETWLKITPPGEPTQSYKLDSATGWFG